MGEKERGLQEEERRQAPRKDSEERVEAGGSDAGESERAAVNTSRSNIKNLRTAGPGDESSDDTDDDDIPAEARSGFVKSKSNITNNREARPGEDDDLDEAAINNTKSNIKGGIANPGGGGEAGIAVSDPGMPADTPGKPKSK